MNRPDVQPGSGGEVPYTPGIISHDRLEFWADTCRDVNLMHHGSKEVIELYRKQGCRFFEPGHDQVQNVLEALDSAMPLWEKTHPELFYQTLELNFPELVKKLAC